MERPLAGVRGAVGKVHRGCGGINLTYRGKKGVVRFWDGAHNYVPGAPEGSPQVQLVCIYGKCFFL